MKTNLPILGDKSAASSGRPQVLNSPIQKGSKRDLHIEVVSDVICPWCYIGKRRLERTIPLLGPDARVTVRWRPFQLNPTMPRTGLERNEYRLAKFGSLEYSQTLDAHVTAVAASEGLEFHLDRIKRTPNTIDAHRLIWLGQRPEKQDAVVEGLFRAYFVDGVDVGDPNNLVAIAAAEGIETTFAEKMLATDMGLEEVAAEENRFKAMGMDGVPAFVVNGRFLFSGAAEPQVMAGEFRRSTAGP